MWSDLFIAMGSSIFTSIVWVIGFIGEQKRNG